MEVDFRYLGKSRVDDAGAGSLVSFAPNLARPKTFFDGELASPVRFREAMSALHDVVVSDLSYKKPDRSAHKAFLQARAEEESRVRREVADRTMREALAKPKQMPPDLPDKFRAMHRLYWNARVRWASELQREDPELFRALVPCDPVVTVAPDVVMFEAFSKDESSYACLSVDRGAFEGAADAGLGTTNVDYSMALFDHLQGLRTYKPTRLAIDPTGFEVSVHGRGDYREEKIDLPPSWLRGFGQLQAAMALPSRSVELSVDVVYSLLALLRRKRDPKTGGRALRFVLEPGRAPQIVVEPWGVVLTSRGPTYEPESSSSTAPRGGPYRQSGRKSGAAEEIKIWGRRRLFALARLLPLADRVEVRLMGNGLPSVWIVRAGELSFTLALSGWTANDWSSGANLDLVAGDFALDPKVVASAAAYLGGARRASLADVTRALQPINASDDKVLAAMFSLAKQGQCVFDYATRSFRYRPVMPFALAESVIGPEPPEPREGRALVSDVHIVTAEPLDNGRTMVVAKVRETSCEAIFDASGPALVRAKCTCSFFHRFGLRGGPCRHLYALRLAWGTAGIAPTAPAREQRIPDRALAEALPKGDASTTGLTFPRALAAALDARAERDNRTLTSLLEEAWDLAFPRIATKKTWALAVALCKDAEPLVGTGHVKPPLASRSTGLHPLVLSEIGKEAARLGASASALMVLAVMMKGPLADPVVTNKEKR
jgi:hypothetical protein